MFGHSRKQHQYHSQRQTRPDNQLRPVSNFYEYESIQSVINGRISGRVNIPSQPVMYQDVNSNSLPRQNLPQQPVQGRQQRSQQHRGPFVTHVTIGEHNQKNGTKV